ncbi:hypothetical protein HX096_09400 [Empedobacter falsenii]|uniref:hypothetical protein n=1 Tax=Empedobacter falsenii TaxID=343874 RepID=UPI002576EAA2|nr:hypothetical protein [Empedobacter falsenii]MDM1548071.1 hypothetical protein [Empedobacter falsenii]
MIKRVSRKKLDVNKYTECLNKSVNYSIYAEVFYLDALVDNNWDCYVLNDYEAIMPLPFVKKFGFKFIVQPIYCQQLGVFHQENFPKEAFQLFEKKLHRNLVRAYAFNEENTEMFEPKGLRRINQILDLNQDYENLFSIYSRNRRNEIRKVGKFNYKIENVTQLNRFFELNSSYEYLITNNLINYSQEKIQSLFNQKIINIYEIFDQEENLLGCQLIMISKNRVYNFAFARNKNSKSNFGSAYIIDYIIKTFSNSELTLDFEGSMVPSIAKFMQGFGAIEKKYTNYSNLDFLTKKN